MNRPCRIHFHEDAAPNIRDLPERYQKNVEEYEDQYAGVVSTLLVQNAFPVDFAPMIIRTRAGGRDEDPVDFPLASIMFIEWFYGSDLPDPLRPYSRTTPSDRQNGSR